MGLPDHITIKFGAVELFTLHELLEMALADNALLERGRHPQGAAMLKSEGYEIKFKLDQAIKAAGYELGAPPDEELSEHDKRLLDEEDESAS
jgi:hypothetical protein